LFPPSGQKALRLLLWLAVLEAVWNLCDTWILPRVGSLGLPPASPITAAVGWAVLHGVASGVMVLLFRALRGQPGARLAGAAAAFAALMALLCVALVFAFENSADPGLARVLRFWILLGYGGCPLVFATLLWVAVTRAARPQLPVLAGIAYVSLRVATALVRESTVMLHHLSLRPTMTFVMATYAGEIAWVLADIAWIVLLVRILRAARPEILRTEPRAGV
jgi:hypothetical protein